jgi:predicted ATP-grasp superfamily ATP-dependent carboligase
MNAKALLIVHRGSPSTPRLVGAIREKGFEPVVLSSKPFDDGTEFRAVCAGLGVDHVIADSIAVDRAEALRVLGDRLEGCKFCYAVWDGQRRLMAELNELLGAPDVAPAAITLAQDKLELRRMLRSLGLSGIAAFPVTDRALRERLDRGERHIVKPRRGSGSLSTRAVRSWAEVEPMAEAFAKGAGEGDLFAEFFDDNELMAETFFEGRELSVELVRQGGRTLFACEHEKTVLEFTDSTVLERGLASPAIGLTAEEIATATALAERTLEVVGLGEGCYHVELRVGATGHCEIIEVNPRIGGAYIADSVRQQFDRSMTHDWLDMLAGRTPAANGADRRCGTYFQLAYAEQGRRIVALEKNATLPAPELFLQMCKLGGIARADREDIAAIALWRTDLAAHRREVERLATNEYISFVYAP